MKMKRWSHLLPLLQRLLDLIELFFSPLGLGDTGLTLVSRHHGNRRQKEAGQVEGAKEEDDHNVDHGHFTFWTHSLQREWILWIITSFPTFFVGCFISFSLAKLVSHVLFLKTYYGANAAVSHQLWCDYYVKQNYNWNSIMLIQSYKRLKQTIFYYLFIVVVLINH